MRPDSLPPPPGALPHIAPAVLRWQARHGRHDLPWQGTREPYRVWLSEIMLQQTQVATVRAYWPRFVAAFPDVKSLAAAPQDAVLALWSGLGYYARARNLHRCARTVLERPDGQFPRRAAELAQLPGIGRSTAAAIAAICHGERVAILDANVRRVLSRVLAFGADLSKPAPQRQLWQWAEALCPRDNLLEAMPAYTQGMMDLGAMLCLPRRPQCSACPLRTCCRAAHSGEPENWPQRTRRSARTRLDWWLLLRLRPGPPMQVWLQRRPGSGIWAGLHAPPAFASRAALEQGARAACIQPLAPRMHILTHRELHLHPVLVEDAAPPENAAGRWVDVHHPGNVGLPAPVRSLLEEIATLKEALNNPVAPLAQADSGPALRCKSSRWLRHASLAAQNYSELPQSCCPMNAPLSPQAHRLMQAILERHRATFSDAHHPAQPLPAPEHDSAPGLAALHACAALGFAAQDARLLARAWHTRGQDCTDWPDEPQHFGMQPAGPAFAPCPQELGLYAVLPDAQWVGRMARAGVHTLQLRFKSSDRQAIAREVRAAVDSVLGTNARLFINDHWRAAIAAGAWGVHLGQEDLDAMAPGELEALRASGLRLGVSTHSYAEIVRAHAVQPSYIALGAVFATTLKQMATPPQGLGRLAAYVRLLTALQYPLVAIGGIDAGRLAAVRATGVGSVAVVRALVGAPDAQAAARHLLQLWQQAR